jgi:SAM-dependent methyltransferase
MRFDGVAMRVDQLQDFVAPDSAAALQLEDAKIVDGQVESGTLITADRSASFPIVNFIPRFVGSGNYAANFGLQWQIHAKTQLDSYNGATYSRDRLLETTGWPENLRGERILEAGSGAGRFTEVLASTGARIYTFDYSEAVVANYQNNSHKGDITFFQGDIYRIPFPKASFDRVICLGVIQHTPDVHKTFRCLADMVRPGGYLAVDVYRKIWKQMLHWKYLMRPVTRRMKADRLYKMVSWYAPKLMPVARVMRKIGGRAGARLVPILDQSDKSVPPDVQRDWTILDTYDALSPAYDYPQTDETIASWFAECGFEDIYSNDGKAHGRKKS